MESLKGVLVKRFDRKRIDLRKAIHGVGQPLLKRAQEQGTRVRTKPFLRPHTALADK